MKLQTLLEMPDFIDKEMPTIDTSTVNFYSKDTIDREFELVGTSKIDDIEYWIILKKDKSFASIGRAAYRKEDDKAGIQLIGKLDFKDVPDFSFNKLIKINEKVLQVDSVEIYSKDKFKGIGYLLYLSLVQYGYILVSDHVQYIGGKKLWEKIAKLSSAKDYSVYIVNNGDPILDSGGELLKYNGTNLADDKIWAKPTTNITDSKRYVLLVMKKNT